MILNCGRSDTGVPTRLRQQCLIVASIVFNNSKPVSCIGDEYIEWFVAFSEDNKIQKCCVVFVAVC
jgi:hypothetical protein